MVSAAMDHSGDDRPLDAVYERADCTFQDSSKRFHHATKEFSRQFFHIYAQRLTSMKEKIRPRIESEWGRNVPIKRLADLVPDETEPCAIIGTLFKHQELKPSILKEISEEYQLIPQPERVHFTDDGDQLILEDDLQRIRLLGSLDVHSVVTGIVCAVFGVQDDGKFMVEKYLFADVASQQSVERPISLKEDQFVVFISGLEFASNAESYFPLQLFVDWVAGWIGNPEEQHQQAKIARVIVAGNIVRGSSQCRTKKLPDVSESLDSADSLEAIKLADDFLQQLAITVPVDIMPGEFDPTNCTVPQQPLHCCMFPKAAAFKTLHSASNPYECQISGRTVLGTSGQGVNDVLAYSKLTDNLDALEKTLLWGHLMPTAPDTLKCYPYYEEDPFIISECPEIYFAGNMPKFQTKLLSGPNGQQARLVCIPKFSTTHSCVVVNLRNFDCYTVAFGMGRTKTDAPFDVDK